MKAETYDDQVRSRLKVERTLAHHERQTGKALGTPETVEKAKRITAHPIDALLAGDRIDQSEAFDLWAIEWGYRLVTESVSAKLSSPYRSDPGESPEPLAAIRCQMRYRLWAGNMKGMGRGQQFLICLDVAVDGKGIRTIEAMRGIGHGRVMDMLHSGLSAYEVAKKEYR